MLTLDQIREKSVKNASNLVMRAVGSVLGLTMILIGGL